MYSVIVELTDDPTSWPDDVPELVTEALELRTAEGVDLLARVTRFNVWRGNLGEMRSDMAGTSENVVPSTNDLEHFREVVALSKAVEYLQPRCSEAVFLTYVRGYDTRVVAKTMQTTDRYAEKLVVNCVRRLFEIARQMMFTGADRTQSMGSTHATVQQPPTDSSDNECDDQNTTTVPGNIADDLSRH